MKIVSWNINGIRSNIVDFTNAQNKTKRILIENSPLYKIIHTHNPDIICFQETRLGKDNYRLFDHKSINSSS